MIVRDAHRRCDVDPPAGDGDQLGDAIDHGLRQSGRRRGLLGRSVQDCELIAAKPGDHIVRTDQHRERGSEFDEELVADGVAVDVVDAFEAIEIDEEQCCVIAGAS